MCSVNSHSLVNKLNKFQCFVLSSDLHIFAVTETWLSSSITNTEVISCGLTFIGRTGILMVEGFYLLSVSY